MGKIPQVGEPAPFFAAATDGVERYSLEALPDALQIWIAPSRVRRRPFFCRGC